jgi:hypothetical protein
MNSPQPMPSGINVAPSFGCMVGGALGLVAVAKLGLNPLMLDGGVVAVGIATVVTAVFQWLGKKTGLVDLS